MTPLLLIPLAALVLLNAFFVAAEFALVRSRRAKIEQLARDGSSGARTALGQLDNVNQYLAACQLGITVASIGIGFLGEPVLAHLLRPIFGGLSHGVSVGLAVALAYIIVTAAHITAGEQVPKVMAITRAESTLRRVARPLAAFSLVMRPFVVSLNHASNAMLRLFGVQPSAAFAEGGTIEDLKLQIVQSLHGGALDEGEAGMLSGVFHLHEQEAREVMTPTPAIVTVDISEDVEQALRRCVSSGHTRLVVIEDENPDRVRGIVHANALVERLMDEGRSASIEPLVREAPIVPETRALDDLLADLQRQRMSLAVVADEYGRTAGIVTVEDIVEEVVGEITDETDPLGGPVRRLPNGDWFVRGHVSITDLLDHGLELPVDTDAYTSVGGFVFATLGRLPKRGDTITANGFRIRVESVRENRIEAVRISERHAIA